MTGVSEMFEYICKMERIIPLISVSVKSEWGPEFKQVVVHKMLCYTVHCKRLSVRLNDRKDSRNRGYCALEMGWVGHLRNGRVISITPSNYSQVGTRGRDVFSVRSKPSKTSLTETGWMGALGCMQSLWGWEAKFNSIPVTENVSHQTGTKHFSSMTPPPPPTHISILRRRLSIHPDLIIASIIIIVMTMTVIRRRISHVH